MGRGKEENLLALPHISIVSLQEADRMNILLSCIRKSFLDLELGISGALNVTESMESLAAALQNNKSEFP